VNYSYAGILKWERDEVSLYVGLSLLLLNQARRLSSTISLLQSQMKIQPIFTLEKMIRNTISIEGWKGIVESGTYRVALIMIQTTLCQICHSGKAYPNESDMYPRSFHLSHTSTLMFVYFSYCCLQVNNDRNTRILHMPDVMYLCYMDL
jgi:hypothetical protein